MAHINRGYEFREVIGGRSVGRKVLEYLTERYRFAGREEWLKRMESGQVRMNGISAQPEMILSAGAVLSWLRPPWEEPDAPLDFAILYQDEHVLGVAKPEGLPTMPGGGQFMDNTLLALVRRRFPEANPLHRLGRGTSGVVLFARTQPAFAFVSKSWSRGEILKVYRTLAIGWPKEDEFDINVPIRAIPHPVLKTIHAASMDGKPSRSHVRVLERRSGCSLMEVRIATGRPHQIRIHLAAAGHPLVRDPLYGIGGTPMADSRALPGDLGYHLHSERLGFTHPVTHIWTEISCFPPPLLRPEIS